jgi:hypothetical protein
MNTLDIYISQDIISYLNIDTKLCVKYLNKYYREIIGRIKFTTLDVNFHDVVTYTEPPILKRDGEVKPNGVYIGAMNGSVRIMLYAWYKYGVDCTSEGSFIPACASGDLDCVRYIFGDKSLCPLYHDEEHYVENECIKCDFINHASPRIHNSPTDLQNGFEVACRYKHHEIIRWLVDNGATYIVKND